jgi:hypothetical protein
MRDYLFSFWGSPTPKGWLVVTFSSSDFLSAWIVLTLRINIMQAASFSFQMRKLLHVIKY